MSENPDTATAISPEKFRSVLGIYPTGVTVVTAVDATGEPIGMTVGSFTSVSLDPPLVAFLPTKTSSSWAKLRESGARFCVNVLRDDQEDVCRAVAARKEHKFEGIGWRESPEGNPIVDGAVAWIDCTTDAILDGGDHEIVVGRVLHLEEGAAGNPLLFFRGGYGSFTSRSLASGDRQLLGQLKYIDLARTYMDDLAQELDTEVTAITRMNDELILAASAGQTDIAVAPTRVGQRLPFMAPIGSCFVAWGDNEIWEKWVAPLQGQIDDTQFDALLKVPELVRERGYATAYGHEPGRHLEAIATQFNSGDPNVPRSLLKEAILHALESYNRDRDLDEEVELRSLSAPVFDPDGSIIFMLTLWGRSHRIAATEIHRQAELLCASAEQATQAISNAV